MGRPAGPRKALLRSLVEALFTNEKITTTATRAQEMRRFAERMITLAKDGDQAARRRAFAFLQNKEIVTKLFEEYGPRFKERPGGYTRIIKAANRRMGDGAEMAIIEFVDRKFITVEEAEAAAEPKTMAQRARAARKAAAAK
ncbi:TPA: 50S ribosomal protein L17 [Candidatus Sumerlaeota bacterium]|nr:50S ribosomal protein L17 [Candidatus Sumerlaeota bacterium]